MTKIKEYAFNFSGSVIEEGINLYDDIEILDFSHLNGTCRYLDDEASGVIQNALADLVFPSLRWIDGGDYHYMSKLLSDRVNRPFRLVLLDHHPDMQPPSFGGVLSCGSWLADAMDTNDYLKSVIMIGIDPSLQVFTQAYRDRVLVYPKGSELPRLVDLAGELPIYLSIDKDVLSTDYARTNWDQGTMTLSEMEMLLSEITSSSALLGADVCGALRGGASVDLEINKATNKCIRALLSDNSAYICR